MRHAKLFTALAFAVGLLSCLPVALGAVPTVVNYQGRLTDTLGMPVNTSVAMTFTVYDKSISGSPLWTETQSAVLVLDGLFQVLLGSSSPIPDSLFADAGRWLGIQIGLDQEQSPRTLLVSSPYAYHAAYADSSPGSDNWATNADDVYRLSGRVGIGTSSPTAKLHVLGSLTIGSASHTNAAILTNEWGGPAQGLAVHNQDWAGGNDSWGLLAAGHGYYYGGLDIGSPSGYVSSDGELYTRGNTWLAAAEGNVGIGTIDPDLKLSVSGMIGINSHSAATPTSQGLFLRHNGTDALLYAYDYPNARPDPMLFEAKEFRFRTHVNGAEFDRVFIDNSGNVGIGTILPASKLHVTGSTRFEGQLSLATNSGSEITGDDGNVLNINSPYGIAVQTTGTNSPLVFITNALARMMIDGAGDVGIGVENPSTKLDVAGDVQIVATTPSPSPLLRVSNGTGSGDFGQAILARTYSSTGNMSAVQGQAMAQSGNTFGLWGITESNSSTSSGIGSAAGVYGLANYAGSGGDVFGVLGVCRTAGGDGSLPNSFAAGVYGQAHNSITAGLTAGVFGESWSTHPSAAGVYGKNNATSGSTSGVIGQTDSPAGKGVFGIANQAGGYGVYGKEQAGGAGAAVFAEGDYKGTGAKYAVVPTSKGYVGLACIEAPEIWFEDFGEGQLSEGQVFVELDPLFLETVTISESEPIKVFLTLNDDCKGLYVVRSVAGFTVREIQGGKSDSRFSYRVVAKRKGFESNRLELQNIVSTGQNKRQEGL